MFKYFPFIVKNFIYYDCFIILGDFMANYDDQYEVQKLKYKSLDGFSEKQISFHHDVHYAGYVKKRNEVNGKLNSLASKYFLGITYKLHVISD